ncbi:hypothetical protein [Sphingomonas glaciei]|uniref:GAF domain-containing protein n=1 Tax=Sphingomonas glaciei TaxID=2938948 RepID=A0ABY5MQM0_9SPHN|nr:hypothetical protein [Sphingomonas glaciei]UUR06804.1 hypothetical protein M1K48_07500 [Sphingomonas glaciei]
MIVDQAVREAELAFLNAPFTGEGWQLAIRNLAESTGSFLVQMCGGSPAPAQDFNIFSHDLGDPYGHLINPDLYGPQNWRLNSALQAPGSIQYEQHYATYRGARKCEYYDDASSDLDLRFGCQSPLLFDNAGLIGLCLLRSGRDGPCTSEVLDAFSSVARQAQRAVRVQLALGQEQGETMLEGVASSGEMTLLLDGQGRLVAMTEAAEILFDHPAGLRLDGLSVRLSDRAEDRSLQAAAGRLLASDGVWGPVLHEAVAGRCAAAPQGQWRLFLTRLPEGTDLLQVGPQLALTLRPAAGTARLA